jgi:hypothetical protein
MNSEEYCATYKTMESSQAFDLCEEHNVSLTDYYNDNPIASRTGWVCTRTFFRWLGY